MTPKQLQSPNAGTKILTTVFIGLVLLSGYYTISSYYSFLNSAEKDMLSRLKGIANTLALQINGDAHQQLFRKYQQKDAITSPKDDSLYQELHQTLRAAHQQNELKTPIYTLSKSPQEKAFYFVVTSALNPYYRHKYKSYPSVLRQRYKQGGVIPAYEDEHGVWLSAFAPIHNSDKKVVGVVQVDMKFNNFIQKARNRLLSNIVISIIVFIIIVSILSYYIRGIWRDEERTKKELRDSRQIIEEKNKSILSSMRYASRIQQAIFDRPTFLQQHFSDSFVLNKPRDMVSGDFFWCGAVGNNDKVDLKGRTTETPRKLLVAVVDCTGHGVPGALMSVIGFSLLNEIVLESYTTPAEILEELNLRVIDTLKQDTAEGRMHDGMDIALCAVDKNERHVEFAGANRPLYYVYNGTVETIKGDSLPIGGMQYERHRQFTNQSIEVKKGACIYFGSDGYVDQFGGPGKRSEKFKPKRLRALLKKHYHKEMNEQYHILDETFEEWKGQETQIDDVAFIGIRL